jgi:phosphate transport system substrate-binding protein
MRINVNNKFAAVSALLVGCLQFALASDHITIAGSTTVKVIVVAAVQEYKKRNPTVEFVVGEGGSGQGIRLAGEGAVSIGMVSRPLDDAENQRWSDLVKRTIGLDGVALVANATNPVRNLTSEQIQNIYTGKITNWKELGGPNARITLCTLNSKHGTDEVFLNYFGLEEIESGQGESMSATHRKKGDRAYSAVTARVIEDHRQVLARVMTDPNALGYVSVGQVMQVVAAGARVNMLSLDGMAPTIANVRSGVYKFSKLLFVITKADAPRSIRDFVDFLSGPKGQAIVAKFDYIPVADK